jgi:hypothetical protein
VPLVGTQGPNELLMRGKYRRIKKYERKGEELLSRPYSSSELPSSVPQEIRPVSSIY